MSFNPVPKPSFPRRRGVKRAPSIMQSRKECYVTGSTTNLHKHHIYFGNPYRKLSEKYGCWIWLRGDWHNQSNYGVHFNSKLDKRLKRECQMRFEEIHGREKFTRVFGRSYL